MGGHWTRQLGVLGLAALVLVAAALLLPLLGAPAMLMQAGGWVVGAMLVFLLVQFAIFRALDLRSRADERPEDAQVDEEPADDDADWRAWRG